MGVSQLEYLKSGKFYCSIFHRGGTFICQMEKLIHHTKEGTFEWDQVWFFKTTLKGNRPHREICSEQEYKRLMNNLRAERVPSSNKPVEEKYEYGYRFSDKVLKDREPYRNEWFGDKPPDIQETIKRFVKPPMTDDDYRSAYPCENCKGKGTVLQFDKYDGRVVRFSRRGPEVTTGSIYSHVTCSVCGGRGYDIGKVLRNKGFI